jgi:hypothetical protein
MGVELAAVEAKLDETQGNLLSCRDHNTYTLERLGAYNVVVVVMPAIGTNRTAAVATQLLNDCEPVRGSRCW